ncbi:MAG: cyclic nucleotide-binding domain-containing protein [archaeon]|nr:cyclic nucleotide-binding domain-containing protein [archaeon]
MSIGHQKLCQTMTLHHYKPNDIIVRQGDVGDSYYYILSGSVSVKIRIKTIGSNGQELVMDKSLKELRAGEGFGELALLYGTPRSATIVSITSTSFIRISKANFDLYLKDFLDNQLHDRIEFLKLCPIFNKMTDQCSVDIGKNTETKQFSTGEIIAKVGDKCDYLYIIRRGTVRVSKKIQFYKDDTKIKRAVKRKEGRQDFVSFEDMEVRHELRNEKVLQQLAKGPSEDEILNGESEEKDITVEMLRIGDVFPTFYSLNKLYLDVNFAAENPCEVIMIKENDIETTLKNIFDYLQKYAKPYPSDEFLRKFYYYNDAWMKYRVAVRENIMNEYLNNDILKKKKMRSKLYPRRDMSNVKLPSIFRRGESYG